MAPVARLQAHGWGVAEIGGLALFIVGPFLLWCIGPIFGILLIRAAAFRWSPRAMHVATVIVFGFLALQIVMAVALYAFVLVNGGSAADELHRLVSNFGPGGLLDNGITPPVGNSGIPILVAVVAAWLAPLAGISAAVYLALSPRDRSRPGTAVARLQ